MSWQAVTFVTLGTPYEREVSRLKESATALDIPLTVYGYQPRGSWRANLVYKPECILQATNEYNGLDIVWVDADARFRKWPVLFDGLSYERDYDIAFHRLRWHRRPVELLSGTMWVANTERGRELVKAWRDRMVAAGGLDQVVLDDVIRAAGDKWMCYELPIEYAAIFDHPAVRGRVAPVIEHFQASRRYKRAVHAGI